MKCPRCGNEVSSEEAFCGQCGMPNTAPQALQTEMVNTPPPRSGRLNSYPTNGAFGTQNPYRVPPTNNTEGASFSPPSSVPPQPPSANPGFYQDATEAMPLPPSNPNAGYQQPYPMTPPSNAYPSQSTPGSYRFPGQLPQQGPPLQSGNYARSQAYPPQQPVQGYRRVPTPPQKQQNGAIIFIVSICLVIALLSVVGVGTLYILKGRNATPKDPQTQGIAPTATAVPTQVPTATATTEPTATPTTAPTAVSTAPPVAGFAYCGPPCVTNGFSTQYPQGWSAIPLTGLAGIQFVNPNPTDQSATFKTPGATTAAPSDLVGNDLQQNFMNKSGYTVVTPKDTGYIGGETWFKEVITYLGETQQKEYVEVYVTVHQSKAYILELQAAEDQFPTVTTSSFTTIKSQFQFQ